MSEEEWTNAEMRRSLQRIETDVAELRTEVRNQAAGYVSRGEFDAWRAAIGREIGEGKSALATFKAEVSAAKAPWWNVWPSVVSTAAFAVTLIVILAQR